MELSKAQRKRIWKDWFYAHPRAGDGSKFVAVPPALHAATKAFVVSKKFHEKHDVDNGFHTHTAALATRSARVAGNISKEEAAKALLAHRKAGKLKHGFLSQPPASSGVPITGDIFISGNVAHGVLRSALLKPRPRWETFNDDDEDDIWTDSCCSLVRRKGVSEGQARHRVQLSLAPTDCTVHEDHSSPAACGVRDDDVEFGSALNAEACAFVPLAAAPVPSPSLAEALHLRNIEFADEVFVLRAQLAGGWGAPASGFSGGYELESRVSVLEAQAKAVVSRAESQHKLLISLPAKVMNHVEEYFKVASSSLANSVAQVVMAELQEFVTKTVFDAVSNALLPSEPIDDPGPVKDDCTQSDVFGMHPPECIGVRSGEFQNDAEFRPVVTGQGPHVAFGDEKLLIDGADIQDGPFSVKDDCSQYDEFGELNVELPPDCIGVRSGEL